MRHDEEEGENTPNGSGMSRLVLRSIEKALRHYGDTTPSIIMWNFESCFKVHKEEILRYPDEFLLSLEKMFGAGSKLIESVIVREIKYLFPDLERSSQLDLITALRYARDHV